MTPIQLVQAFAVIANGGKHNYQAVGGGADGLRPPILASDQRILPQITLEIQLKPTTWEPGPVKAWRKRSVPVRRRELFGDSPLTGSSGGEQEQPSLRGKSDYALFASYAPADNPELVILVAVEEGGSFSLGAAPVARRLYQVYFGLRKPAASSRQQPAQEAKTPRRKKTPAGKLQREKTPVEKTPVEKAPALAEKNRW